MDDQQHKDGYPWTWEPAAAVALGLATIAVLSLQLGRTAALLVTGSGTWWPAPEQLITSTWGITQGHLDAGLPNVIHDATAPPWLAWTLAAVFALALSTAGGWLLWRLRGHGAMKGMATTDQANQLLGVARLRKNRRIIRPDLYGRGLS